MGCEWCSGNDCVRCRCVVCGVGVAAADAEVLQCAACCSMTHAACAPSDVLLASPQFYCSTTCRFGVTLDRNPSFNVALSARLELKCDRLWQEMTATDAGAYCRLRYRMWAEYFEREKHRLPMISRCHNFAADVQLLLVELFSPEGQAGLLCTLHPVDHPVGSVIASPASWVWQTPLMQPGSSSNYIAEAAEMLRATPRGKTPRRQAKVRRTYRRRETG